MPSTVPPIKYSHSSFSPAGIKPEFRHNTVPNGVKSVLDKNTYPGSCRQQCEHRWHEK